MIVLMGLAGFAEIAAVFAIIGSLAAIMSTADPLIIVRRYCLFENWIEMPILVFTLF